MLILVILLAFVWIICVNAILIDAEKEAEENKRKFWLVANSSKKLFPKMTGNGEASEEDFLKGEI